MVEFSKGGHCLSSKATGKSHSEVSGKHWEGKWFFFQDILDCKDRLDKTTCFIQSILTVQDI